MRATALVFGIDLRIVYYLDTGEKKLRCRGGRFDSRGPEIQEMVKLLGTLPLIDCIQFFDSFLIEGIEQLKTEK